LEKLAPGRYTQLCNDAAKRVLENPVTAGTRLAAVSEGYLYAWLGSQRATAAVAHASAHLYDATGKLNLDAARYLVAADPTTALPMLKQAYDKTTDHEAQTRIANAAFDAVGASPDADSIFKAYILTDSVVDANSGSLVARPRELVIRSLAGPVRPFNFPAPTDPAVINSRIAALNDIRARLNSGPLVRAVDQTIQQLQGLLPR
jgi:hypothetical protein